MGTPFTYDIATFINTLKRRGISNAAVLKAMESVPREQFIGLQLAEFAYDDSPLPIEEGQTISQPYIVALMTQALGLKQDSHVLEVGAGSGYAAAILSRIAAKVFTIERHHSLAQQARQRLRDLHYDNVEVLCGDGTLGWPEHAPYDAIVVAAGGPDIPRTLIEQLKIGGCLVMPAGAERGMQQLLRVTRLSKHEVETEELGAVRFVPLIGEAGWQQLEGELAPAPVINKLKQTEPLAELIAQSAIHIPSIDTVDLGSLLARIGDARVVLIGEATHGTAEFYDMRARISKELIEKKGFNCIAAEADWPDAAQIDHFVRGTRATPTAEVTFNRFPTWMWANRQVLEFVQWLRHYNQRFSNKDAAAGFYGLDLYSLHSSINAVIGYLETVDKREADIARERYGCLTPWQKDPATYGMSALTSRHRGCEHEVVHMLNALMLKRLQYAEQDGRRYFDAISNARLIKNAEEYYRVMYLGSVNSWNLRDQHMFDTLRHLLDFHGDNSKVIVWAHNSHVGNADATDMGARGEINIGSLCRQYFGEQAYLIGQGTHEGLVAAASDWGAPMEIKQVRASHPDSYERLCHDSGLNNFMLPLRTGNARLIRQLHKPRLQRAIGVIYRPQTEMASHYFETCLPRQFDEYLWFDRTLAVDALGPEAGTGIPETFPFGL